MRKTKQSILFIVVTAWCSVFAPQAPAQSGRAFVEAQRVSRDRFTVQATTPRGVRVFARRRPSPAVLSAIDRGLAELFAAARANGYSRRLDYGDYTIFIGRADRTTDSQGQYSPDIAVGAAQYAGSVYDQGGFIYAAGMVISPSEGAFLIAEHSRDLSRVSSVVRYEGEHIVLFHNDRRRFAQTLDHSRGGGHPIL
ncbi:MAG: hypothetical protein ACK4S4_03535 [Pyrinomonadaceae bacterium]